MTNEEIKALTVQELGEMLHIWGEGDNHVMMSLLWDTTNHSDENDDTVILASGKKRDLLFALLGLMLSQPELTEAAYVMLQKTEPEIKELFL